ncbi:collagen-like triple helix repeat-containing protein, partial [Commensalibacter communis]
EGKPASITVGTITTGEPGTKVIVENVGTSSDVILNFTIPKGDKGEKGEQGIQGEKGDKGDKGDQGDKGDKGDQGQAATIAIGTVTTGEPETDAIVTNVGDENNARLNITIPKGQKGDKGDQGESYTNDGTVDLNVKSITSDGGLNVPSISEYTNLKKAYVKVDARLETATEAGFGIVGYIQQPYASYPENVFSLTNAGFSVEYTTNLNGTSVSKNEGSKFFFMSTSWRINQISYKDIDYSMMKGGTVYSVYDYYENAPSSEVTFVYTDGSQKLVPIAPPHLPACSSLELPSPSKIYNPNETFPIGKVCFLTDLKKPVWWDGSQWVDAMGNALS